MSNLGGNVRAKIVQGKSPKIYNLAMATSGTEYSQALTDNTKKILIKARGNSQVTLAFVSTESQTLYLTLFPGQSYSEDNVDFTGSIYATASKNNEVLEIVEWT